MTLKTCAGAAVCVFVVATSVGTGAQSRRDRGPAYSLDPAPPLTKAGAAQ